MCLIYKHLPWLSVYLVSEVLGAWRRGAVNIKPIWRHVDCWYLHFSCHCIGWLARLTYYANNKFTHLHISHLATVVGWQESIWLEKLAPDILKVCCWKTELDVEWFQKTTLHKLVVGKIRPYLPTGRNVLLEIPIWPWVTPTALATLLANWKITQLLLLLWSKF